MANIPPSETIRIQTPRTSCDGAGVIDVAPTLDRLIVFTSARVEHEVLPSFAGVVPWAAPTGPVPAYPLASNLDHADHGLDPSPVRAPRESTEEIREELRRLIIEELTSIIKG